MAAPKQNIVVPSSVNTDYNFSLKTTASWKKSFDTSNWFASDHDSFNVIVSNVSGGTYKVFITGSDGFTYESADRSGYFKYTKTIAESGVTYTVTVLNTCTSTITGNIKISSYYSS